MWRSCAIARLPTLASDGGGGRLSVARREREGDLVRLARREERASASGSCGLCWGMVSLVCGGVWR